MSQSDRRSKKASPQKRLVKSPLIANVTPGCGMSGKRIMSPPCKGAGTGRQAERRAQHGLILVGESPIVIKAKQRRST